MQWFESEGMILVTDEILDFPPRFSLAFQHFILFAALHAWLGLKAIQFSKVEDGEN